MMENLPEIIPVSPAITRNEVAFEWNHEEVKKYLEAVTEKYVGLIVTDENLADMEKAKREIVRFRTAIIRFKQDGKRKLKAPAERFARECDDLLKVVEDVEGPIAVQLARYEAARKNEVKREIVTEYQMKASAMGLDMANWQLDENSKWYNKTQKWGDTCIAIDRLIKRQVEEQNAKWAAESAAKMAQNAAEGVDSKITHEESAKGADAEISDSTDKEAYLAVKISFTAGADMRELVDKLVGELSDRIMRYGAFPMVSIEKREVEP